MTRNRSLTILGLALLSATVAGFAAVRYTAQRPMPITTERPSAVQMVVAARDLPVGHFLTEADLQVVSWPGNALPVGYISQPANAAGRGLISGVRMNQPIIESGLAERGSGAGLPIIFPEGMRAVSVRVDEVVSVAGYVTPRTRVDVMLTYRPGSSGNNAQTYSQIILQNLLVLAAGQTVQHDEQGRPMTVSVVTLMVTPEQGEKLILAAAQGRIQLALRNMLDVEEVQTPGIGEARLFELGRPPARTASSSSSAPRPRAMQVEPENAAVEIYKGGVRTLQRF
jgi:pilus assembly protein CpaB